MDIPEFQRGFLWDPEQVKFLAESLYRDYPVDSFLLWDSSEYQEAKATPGTQASLWVVYGQQRTTALCLLLGQKPYWSDDADKWNKDLERYDVIINMIPYDGEHSAPAWCGKEVCRKTEFLSSLAMKHIQGQIPRGRSQ